MQEGRQGFLLSASQWRQKRSDGGETPFQELFTKRFAQFGEVKCDRPLVAALATFDETIGDKPIDQAHRSWVRQAENASQLVVSR